MEIVLPHNFEPRFYQKRFYNAIASGFKRGVSVWHRRSGKDKTAINVLVKEAIKQKGMYFYVFPTYTQGKKVIWLGMDRAGHKFLEHIPEAIRKRKSESEMLIELINGSIIQVVGSDNYDALMGSNPIGLIFSEYSLQDPRAWDYIRPILVENNGWAMFIYTPRGHNHGYQMYTMARQNPDWFCELLTVKDTGGYVTETDIKAEIAAGMSEDMVDQEFYCSFEAAMPGAVYGKQIAKAIKAGRVCGIPHTSGYPVNTYWDLGRSDATAIWFVQNIGREIRFIDYYEKNLEDIDHYLKVLRGQAEGCEHMAEYLYGKHYAPHDVKNRRLEGCLWDMFKERGIVFEVAPKLPIEHGIEAARAKFSSCFFDKDRCDRGIDALKTYRYELDEEKQVYALIPVHDWSSHGADAFRTFGVMHRFEEAKQAMKDIDYGSPEQYAGYYRGGL